MRLCQWYLFLTGLGWLGYGLFCLWQPDFLFSVQALSPGDAPDTEVRAMYGGLEAALGVFWMTGALTPRRLESGLLNLTLVLGGLAVARAIGLFLNGPDPYNNGAFAYEFCGTLITLFFLIRCRAECDGPPDATTSAAP